MAETKNYFEIPEGLSEKGKQAAEVIVAYLKEKEALYSGGCKVFYTPKEWAERGECYGRKSLLIVVHDGGNHAGAFDMDHGQVKLFEGMQEALRKIGCYSEGCACWYSAIYEE